MNNQAEVNSQFMLQANSIAMVVVLTIFGMLFATLFLGYAVFRLTSQVWPPSGMTSLPMMIPTVSTVMIALSSLFLWSFESQYKVGLKQKFSLFTSIFFGLAFIVSQFVLWSNLKAHGLFAGSNIFTSIIYAFTWIHVGHMVMALIGLVILLPLIAERAELKPNRVINVAKFWHFLGIIWLLMFLTIFVF